MRYVQICAHIVWQIVVVCKMPCGELICRYVRVLLEKLLLVILEDATFIGSGFLRAKMHIYIYVCVCVCMVI